MVTRLGTVGSGRRTVSETRLLMRVTVCLAPSNLRLCAGRPESGLKMPHRAKSWAEGKVERSRLFGILQKVTRRPLPKQPDPLEMRSEFAAQLLTEPATETAPGTNDELERFVAEWQGQDRSKPRIVSN